MLSTGTTLTILGTIILAMITLRLVKALRHPKVPPKPKVKTLDAVLLWARGDLDHKEAAVGYLKSYLSDAFIKFLAMGVESPPSFEFVKHVYNDNEFTRRTMSLVKSAKTEYAVIIYDPSYSSTITWSNTKKLATSKVSLERDTVLYAHFKTDSKGDNTKSSR